MLGNSCSEHGGGERRGKSGGNVSMEDLREGTDLEQPPWQGLGEVRQGCLDSSVFSTSRRTLDQWPPSGGRSFSSGLFLSPSVPFVIPGAGSIRIQSMNRQFRGGLTYTPLPSRVHQQPSHAGEMEGQMCKAWHGVVLSCVGVRVPLLDAG